MTINREEREKAFLFNREATRTKESRDGLMNRENNRFVWFVVNIPSYAPTLDNFLKKLALFSGIAIYFMMSKTWAA